MDLVIFDVDKTIVKGNLHEIAIKIWAEKNVLRILVLHIHSYIIKLLLFQFLKRKFEYFILFLISDEELNHLVKNIVDDELYINRRLLNRINNYKRRNINVVLISAAPSKIISHISSHLNVNYHSSSMFLGILFKDLLARKVKVYKKLIQSNYIIKSIYSDSKLDFYKDSKSFLIDSSYKCKLVRDTTL